MKLNEINLILNLTFLLNLLISISCLPTNVKEEKNLNLKSQNSSCDVHISEMLEVSKLLDKDRSKLVQELREPELKSIQNENLYASLPVSSKDEFQDKQSSIPNVQSLIDQTNTISSNLELMITEMNNNNRRTTAAMLKVMLNNVRRLNTSLVRLNNRVSNYSSSTTSSSVPAPTAMDNLTSFLISIRNQLNSFGNEINQLMSRLRPGTTNKPSSSSVQG